MYVTARLTDTYQDAREQPRANWRSIVGLVLYWQQFCVPYIRARYGRDERGASLVEYALLVALIAVVCVVALRFLGQSQGEKLDDVGSELDNVPNNNP